MPVTTPKAKLTRKIFPQNFAIFWYTSSPVLTYLVSIQAMSSESPNVSGTKMKWNMVAAANCSRESMSTSIQTPLWICLKQDYSFLKKTCCSRNLHPPEKEFKNNYHSY